MNLKEIWSAEGNMLHMLSLLLQVRDAQQILSLVIHLLHLYSMGLTHLLGFMYVFTLSWPQSDQIFD